MKQVYEEMINFHKEMTPLYDVWKQSQESFKILKLAYENIESCLEIYVDEF